MIRRTAAVPRGVATATPAFAVHALNAELWDVEGRRYVDFAGGIAVLNVGHRHPRIIAAVQAQLERFTHTAFQVMAYENYVELAERLNGLAPIEGPAKTILFTTGAEATENCIKIARAATSRTGVIAFTGGFHGRTALASALTGKVIPYKRDFGPALPDVFHAPFPSEASGITVDDSLRLLDFLFAADVAPTSVAAIIVEPVQGEGGFHVAPRAFLEALREICDVHGILLVADEVQSGFARTGRMFAIEHSGVQPDLIAAAKSLAGGFPLSAVIGRAEVMDAPAPGGLGGTYAGSPVACAAALAVLDVVAEERLLERAEMLGGRLRARIDGWQARNDLRPVANVRGLGAMIGFDVLETGETGSSDSAAKRVCQRALEEGLVPLTASDEIVEEGLDRLEVALSATP
jgi:4-aminobutyrate aminotransferase/(S)-3-amino-2-methylpropionate transaminase